MNDTDRQRLDAAEAALRELTRRLAAMEQGEFHPGGEGFRIGTLRLFEKLSGDLYHLHQRDEDGAENDLTDALSIQGTPVSETAPTAAQVLVYNTATGKWEPTAAGAPGAHVLATIAGLGPSHTTSGLTAGQVLRATAAGAAAFQAIQAGDIPATIMRDAEHTAIGDGAPHHARYTDAEVAALITIHAAVAAAHHAVFTTTEHTAIGDGAPHHAEAHTVASHNDTTATGTELETLTDASDASSLHVHKKTVIFKILAHDTALTTGDGKEYWTVPSELNGWNLTDADAAVYTASTAGGNAAVGPIQIYNVTHTADMLSTGITLDQDEYNSYTANTQPVIDAGEDDVATGDRLRFDVDTAAGTGTKGLDIIMVFTKP